MDSALSVIEAIIPALKQDDAVTALVNDRVYTDVPQKVDFPYVVLSIDSDSYGADDFSGQKHMLRIQAFSRVSPKEALSIRKACLDLLDRGEGNITLDTGALVRCDLADNATMFKEDDGKTWQAVGELELVVV